MPPKRRVIACTKRRPSRKPPKLPAFWLVLVRDTDARVWPYALCRTLSTGAKACREFRKRFGNGRRVWVQKYKAGK